MDLIAINDYDRLLGLRLARDQKNNTGKTKQYARRMNLF